MIGLSKQSSLIYNSGMEDLTKHQIVLVAILVAFVTSITTGIVTVSLMDQSSPSVPQVINRVVERTIEKVIPSQQSAAVVIRETIVVRSEDQVVAAINKNSGSVIRIYSTPSNQSVTTETFLGLGLVLTKSGLIVSDKSIIGTQINYIAHVSGGKSYGLELQNIEDPNLAVFKVVSSVVLAPVVLSQAAPRLGQSVLSIGGETNIKVAMGIVSEFVGSVDTTAGRDQASITVVKTDILPSVEIGSPLINLTGEVVGIKTSNLNPEAQKNSLYLFSSALSGILLKAN